MQLVFDGPVGADEFEQPLGPGLGCGQTGDEIDDLGAVLVADPARALDARDLGGARPVEVRDDFGADGDLARLDAAMAFVERLAAARSGGGPSATPPVARGERSPKLSAMSAFSAGWLSLTTNR